MRNVPPTAHIGDRPTVILVPLGARVVIHAFLMNLGAIATACWGWILYESPMLYKAVILAITIVGTLHEMVLTVILSVEWMKQKDPQ